MKKVNIIAVTLIVFLVFSNVNKAKDNNEEKIINKANIQNLSNGFNSENIGLKRHCIYLAGKYKLSRLYNELLEIYKYEKNNSVKKLILFSMFEIKKDDSVNDFLEIALNEKNEKLKNIAVSAFYELNISDSSKYYTKLTK